MKTLGNILWYFPFLGFVNALFTFLLGGLLVITVIGAPIGMGLIQLSKFLLAPFSSSMVDKQDLNIDQNALWKSFGFIIRILYFPFGLILVVFTIFEIAGLFVSIVGIPVAIVLAKSVSTFFNPVNKKCVPVAVAVADELQKQKAQNQINKHLAKN